jgi:polyisoprenoid-binding protein YceI
MNAGYGESAASSSGRDPLLRRSVFTAALAVCALGVPALAADYSVDVNHTQATFTVTHFTISRVAGKVPVTSGTVALGANDVPTAINMTFSAKDIDSQSEGRDKDLRSANWFEVEKYPTITFVSKTITGAPQAFTVVGDLTMHGVTKPATLTGKLLGKITDSRGRTHVGYSATGTLDRRNWGLMYATAPGGNLIAGYDVTIDANVEVISQ